MKSMPHDFPIDRAPWERQPGESAAAFEAFAYFRDLSPLSRKIATVARDCKSGPKTVNTWASKYRWNTRAQLFDDEKDRIRTQRRLEAIGDMEERHAKAALAMLGLALKRLVGDEQNEKLKADDLAPEDVRRWIDTAVKIERTSRGEPETIAKQQVKADVTVGTEDPKERLAGLLARLSARIGANANPGGNDSGGSGGSADDVAGVPGETGTDDPRG